MLVLTRREQEVIMIGDDIRITLIESHRGKVRIGIDAPKELPIARLEVYERMKQESHLPLKGAPRGTKPAK